MGFEFYEERDFKDTELGPLPVDWEVVRLGEVAEIRQGRTPRLIDYDSKKGCRIIKVKDFVDGGTVSLIPMSERGFVKESASQGLVSVQAGDVLILNSAHSSEIVGQKVGIVPKELAGSFYVAELTAIRAIESKSTPYFLFSILQFPIIRITIKSLVKGGHLYARHIFNLPIPLPPLEEQKAIAEVLRSVQSAIEKTEEVIRAVKELKKSMMKYLFTYGYVPVDETDKVKLKETEIGLIPEHWKVVRLGEVAEIVMGQSPPGTTYNNDGIGVPFLQGKAEFGNIYPSATKYTTYPLKISKVGSILFSVRAPVGDVNIADREYCIGRGLACIKLEEGENKFLFYYLNFAKEKIEKLGTGSTFKAISKSELQSLSIPLPPLEEQKAIAEVLRAIDDKLQKEEEYKKALQNLFKSLLHHLMSGKIRVSPKPFYHHKKHKI